MAVSGHVHHYNDNFEGWSIFVSSNNPYFRKSLQFAQYLGSALLEQDLIFSTYHSMNIKGERKKMIDSHRGIYNSNNLAILKRVNTPSVLIEAGFIVNRKEEIKISTNMFREKFADLLSKAVKNFCNSINK